MLLSLPQVSALSLAEFAEQECPCEEDGENAEEEFVVCSSARRRLKKRQHIGVDQPLLNNAQFRNSASHFDCASTIVGHQLSNGLCAPLLV
jgi:hypothetical protein